MKTYKSFSISNDNVASMNQKLVGHVNPKTLIAPIVAPRLCDLDYWRDNNMVNHSGINTESQTDTYLSGYEVSSQCKNNNTPVIYDKPMKTLYNINNSIERLPEYTSEYNKNLFTQNIQPDVYTINQCIEPISSNIGISLTPQFGQLTISDTVDNGIMYTENGSGNMLHQKQNDNIGITESNVTDPRFYGYGTSYRSYTDTNVGQTRFYYDDINAIRMPNYICRSNLDFAKYADSYGSLNDDNKYGNSDTANIRTFANNTFLESSLQQRRELQERLMRKRNNELWQDRKYPKHLNFK